MTVRWRVLLMTAEASWSVDLPTGRPVVVGHGDEATLDVPRAGVSPRHVSLLARDESVTAEPLRGGGDVLLNDVPIDSHVSLRAGDEVIIGQARLLIVAVTPPSRVAALRVLDEDEFAHRLDDEVTRASGSTALFLLSTPGLNVSARQSLVRRVTEHLQAPGRAVIAGQIAFDLLGLLFPAAVAGELEALFARLPQLAGPRARLSWEIAEAGALDAHGLLGRCLDQLIEAAPGEPVLVDPVMVRLGTLLERLEGSASSVCFIGPAGVGRSTLARTLASFAGKRLRPEATRKGTDWLLIEGAHRRTKLELEWLVGGATTRVVATALTRPPGDAFDHVIDVPPLRLRADDVLPLADDAVSRFRASVGRPRLTLGHEARQALRAWDWPGNVRELMNVLFVASRATARDEVGLDALPHRLTGAAEVSSFRGAMQSAEREVMLAALARTRWNVSAAAARLGVPRRTFVHRMARLGLKRPARSPR